MFSSQPYLVAFLFVAFAPVLLLHSQDRPVKAIADHTLAINSPTGRSLLPLYLSVDGVSIDLAHPQPSVTRALIVFHGKQRNAETYNASGLEAIRNAGAAGINTLLITPQFLEQVDVKAHRLPSDILHWAPEAWMSGDNAVDSSIGTFDAIDAILQMLSNDKLFPNLQTIVLAGHSAGGQLVQRYAVAGKAPETLPSRLHVRFVIANPSSYAYFSPERPVLDSSAREFTFAVPAKTCGGDYDNWKYGLLQPPPYLESIDTASIELRYIHRDVIYLLGTADTDPNHSELDKSCSGELEGPFRFFRGKAYFRYLQLRHPELAQPTSRQRLFFVPGVAHDGERMLNSACGLAALFGSGACSTPAAIPRP